MKRDLEQLAAQLTLAEKAALCTGALQKTKRPSALSSEGRNNRRWVSTRDRAGPPNAPQYHKDTAARAD